MCVGMLLLYSHVQLRACCSGEPVSCRPNHRRGFAKLYILFEEKKATKKWCMRIRCLQKKKKPKVKGCCIFFSVWDGRTWSIDVNNLGLIFFKFPIKNDLILDSLYSFFSARWLVFADFKSLDSLHWRLLWRFELRSYFTTQHKMLWSFHRVWTVKCLACSFKTIYSELVLT